MRLFSKLSTLILEKNADNNNDKTIHVYLINLKSLQDYVSIFSSYLSCREKEELSNLLLEYTKRSYILSHGFLKAILSAYLCIPPEEVKYKYNKFGKPTCKIRPNLHFNMSHSNNLVCYVLSNGYRVGIDIEWIERDIDITNLIEIISSPSEKVIFEKATQENRRYLLFKLLTTKESFLKALGIGLSLPLSQIDTKLLPNDIFNVINLKQKKIDAVWSFYPLEKWDSYIGTITVENSKHKIKLHDFTNYSF